MKLSDERVELARRHNKVVYKDGNRIVKSFVRTKPAVDVFRASSRRRDSTPPRSSRSPRSRTAPGRWHTSTSPDAPCTTS